MSIENTQALRGLRRYWYTICTIKLTSITSYHWTAKMNSRLSCNPKIIVVVVQCGQPGSLSAQTLTAARLRGYAIFNSK